MLEIAINQFITYTAISLTSISIRLVMCSTALQKITKGMTNRTTKTVKYNIQKLRHLFRMRHRRANYLPCRTTDIIIAITCIICINRIDVIGSALPTVI